MRIFKAKLVFKRKRSGERKVCCAVAAFKKILKKGIDFKESYAGTARWNTVILVIILAVFYDFPLYLIDIVAFFLHGRLAPGERIYIRLHQLCGWELLWSSNCGLQGEGEAPCNPDPRWIVQAVKSMTAACTD